MNILPSNIVRKIQIVLEIGASNWLTSLPIRAKGFSFNKQEFVDAIALRYGRSNDAGPFLVLLCFAQDMHCATYLLMSTRIVGQ